LYKVADFSNVDSIAVLCRGKSIEYLKNIYSDFNHCFLVGQFDNALKKISKYLTNKKIVQIINKCAIKPCKKKLMKINIQDIQCNFGSYFGEEMDIDKKRLYKKILKLNAWAKVHLVPLGLCARRPFKKWCTCGIYGVDMAAFYQPKKIIILGLDFYCSEYFSREKIQTTIASNKKRKNEMISNLYDIINRDKNIMFYLYTKCKELKSKDNLVVKYV
jgi:hypothetical protein